MARCRSCFAEIEWVKSAKTESTIPLDATPTKDGNIIVRNERAHVYKDAATAFASLGTLQKYEWPLRQRTSHFATCPNADKHRKKK